MKKTVLFFALILFSINAQAQTKKYLTEIYAKSDSEIVAITDNSTDADENYMETVLGRKFRGLMEAMLERGYSPNDFSGSITEAYQAAVDSSGFLIIPASYSTDSTVAYTTAPILDFRSGTLKVTPLDLFMRMSAGPVGSNLAAGLNQLTAQSITSWVGVGRSAGMGANTFIIIDYIEALVEP